MYPSGSVKIEIGYVDGKKEGPAKKYYEDGKVMAEMEYEDDAIISQTIYDKTGRFIFKETRRTRPTEF
jgi:antitoxin component YwqK of YwqJK toxin-antitoxin module